MGLKSLGISSLLTSHPARLDEGFPILLGTSLWRGIEATGEYLLVDRCSVGDTNQWVSLVWNGHGRRGDHRVPPWSDDARWQAMGIELWPQQLNFSSVVLCGQTEPYSPHWRTIEDWYAYVLGNKLAPTHFRPHPAGHNPTGLPEKRTMEDSAFYVLNSSFGVQCLIEGRPTEVHDEGAMAYGVDADSRESWAHWLAWTQWHHEEIEAGEPIAHLFEAL